MKQLLFSCLILSVHIVHAQQWSGSTTTSNLINRNGNVMLGSGNFALNIDTGTRALELHGTNGNIIDMRSNAFNGAFLIVYGNGSLGFNSNFPVSFNMG